MKYTEHNILGLTIFKGQYTILKDSGGWGLLSTEWKYGKISYYKLDGILFNVNNDVWPVDIKEVEYELY